MRWLVRAHVEEYKPRNRLFRYARSLCAQFLCSSQIPRASMAALKRLGSGTRHTVASATVTCLRHSSNGRPICAAQKFPQEQVSSDVPPAQKMGDLSRRACTPARLRIRSVHVSYRLNVVRMLGPGEPLALRTEC